MSFDMIDLLSASSRGMNVYRPLRARTAGFIVRTRTFRVCSSIPPAVTWMIPG
jgi:hypothetical protein